MPPIHDTDVAENRWNQAEWDRYELWERIERRLRAKRRLWIGGSIVIFLMISAIPPFRENWPHWKALALARRLGQEVNQMKREAIMSRAPYRIRLLDGLQAEIERVSNCSDPVGTAVRHFDLAVSGFRWLEPARAQTLGYPGVVNQFCYDPLKGGSGLGQEASIVGLGILPEVDASSGRGDRFAILFLSGPSALVSFE